MQTVYNFSDPIDPRPTVLTIGVFDGVHLGHQALIGRVVESARASGRRAAVVTFFPHPYAVLEHRAPYYLTLIDEKLALFEQLGLDLSVVIEFTLETSRVRAASFVEQLVGRLHMTEMWVGHDFALGYKREGNVTFLRQAGRTHGFDVNELDASTLNGEIISSSRIREALRVGDVNTARLYLGRPFRLAGSVAAGAGRGRRLGFPTANLSIRPEKAAPARGVYACLACVGSARYAAVTNIGVRPTFDGGASTIEAHLLDFDGDLYGQALALDFIARLRAEHKFESAAQLAAQVQSDIGRAREILGYAHRP